MHPAYQLILGLIDKNFPNNKKINLIDYGCGNALFLNYIPRNIIKTYIGFDVNKDSIKNAKNKFGDRKNVLFNLIEQNKKINLGKFADIEVIVLIGVLQYMNETEIDLLFKECARVLKKEGVLIFSCITDHRIYKIVNIYRLFLPHFYTNRIKLLKQLERNKFFISYNKEKGIIIAPLFSNFIVFFFDALDKMIFRTNGRLGPIGTKIRSVMHFILRLEYMLSIDYGYTLFVVAKR